MLRRAHRLKKVLNGGTGTWKVRSHMSTTGLITIYEHRFNRQVAFGKRLARAHRRSPAYVARLYVHAITEYAVAALASGDLRDSVVSSAYLGVIARMAEILAELFPDIDGISLRYCADIWNGYHDPYPETWDKAVGLLREAESLFCSLTGRSGHD